MILVHINFSNKIFPFSRISLFLACHARWLSQRKYLIKWANITYGLWKYYFRFKTSFTCLCEVSYSFIRIYFSLNLFIVKLKCHKYSRREFAKIQIAYELIHIYIYVYLFSNKYSFFFLVFVIATFNNSISFDDLVQMRLR